MAKFIGFQENLLNYGENLFSYALVNYLDDRHVFYKNREIFGREFDFCLLLPKVGIAVIEVKSWKENSIKNVVNDGASVVLKTDEGEVSQTPWRQARGYRFALKRRIKNSLGKKPLIFNMLVYPNISKEFFYKQRLDTISEEEFTFLSEDISSGEAFRAKLNKAVEFVSDWGNQDAFNETLMYQVRSIFESDLQFEEKEIEQIENKWELKKSWIVAPYSYFAYIPKDNYKKTNIIGKAIDLYAQGTKIYLIVEEEGLLKKVISQVNKFIRSKGLIKNKDNLEPALNQKVEEKESAVNDSKSFRCFNFQIHHLTTSNNNYSNNVPIEITDGKGIEEKKNILVYFDQYSDFNLNQFEIEHANSRNNILVRAGAGTGKTHVMISRIMYLCYQEGLGPGVIGQRIVMITFTTDAAENMKERLKKCLQNYYLITRNPDFIEMTNQVDNMSINTIHSYAKELIQKHGAKFGFGNKMQITSSKHYREETLRNILEEYIENISRTDPHFINKLRVPMYKLREIFLGFIESLQNKNIDVRSLNSEQFGTIKSHFSGEEAEVFHEMLKNVVPEVEKRYSLDLKYNNKLHLGTLISELGNMVRHDDIFNAEINGQEAKYMFIDEFQDTDDVQIDTLRRLCEVLKYKLFVVGDVKQCIYRFRGAEELAFERLGIENEAQVWDKYTLNKNYRTDKYLLEQYEKVFSQLNEHPENLLFYKPDDDTLISSINYNQGKYLGKYYKCIEVDGKSERLPALMQQLKNEYNYLKGLIESGEQLSLAERTIALLVRENWQAEEVRREGKKYNFSIITQTGGDLYKSVPATDLYILLSALLNNEQPEYLYKLLTSNFFNLKLNRLELYNMRNRGIGRAGKNAKKQQAEYLKSIIDQELKKALGEDYSWSEMLMRLRVKPVLQVLRNFYQKLQPWIYYSSEKWHQQFYRINVDLLFEKIIASYSMDRLTIHTLADFMHSNIVTKQEEDCRLPDYEEEDITVICSTVHKAKGLEFGYVIIPYGDFPIDRMKYKKLDVTVINNKIGYKVNTDNFQIENSTYKVETELTERKREETRNLYVAITRAIRGFCWIDTGEYKNYLTWQKMLKGDLNHAI